MEKRELKDNVSTNTDTQEFNFYDGSCQAYVMSSKEDAHTLRQRIAGVANSMKFSVDTDIQQIIYKNDIKWLLVIQCYIGGLISEQ